MLGFLTAIRSQSDLCLRPHPSTRFHVLVLLLCVLSALFLMLLSTVFYALLTPGVCTAGS